MSTIYKIEIKDPTQIDDFTNLLLNMMGGLGWNDLSEDEKNMCRENGYDGDKE